MRHLTRHKKTPYARWVGRVLVGGLLMGCGPTQGGDQMSFGDSETVAAEAATPFISSGDRELSYEGLSGAFRDAGLDAPALLIVPGSGPTDRDGNSPNGLQTNLYRQLADALEQAGISSLRVDKRGMFSSAQAGDPNSVSVEIYADDYRDWAERLREETGRPCVFMLGHSEGGSMVSAAAAGGRDGICGLILVAAPGRPFGDILREQLTSNPANKPILPDALGAISALEKGETVNVSGFHPALQPLFAPQVQGFLISLLANDPVALLRDADLPTLIVQGDRDLQVTEADAKRLAADGGTLVILPGVNHILKEAPKGRSGNLATYTQPDLPLSDGAVSVIVDFVRN